MQHLLDECRENFGAVPRTFSLGERLTYLRVAKPAWLRDEPRDDLSLLFENLEQLFSHGIIVWAHLIQANQLMFEAGHNNCPGDVVYSIEDGRRVEADYLQQVAHSLFRLKGTAPSDPELRRIADHLTNEYERVFGLPVPGALSQSCRCRISTTFFVRQHLPERRLCRPLFPIVVNPYQPHLVIPVPEKYWPKALKDWWVGSHPEPMPDPLTAIGEAGSYQVDGEHSSARRRVDERMRSAAIPLRQGQKDRRVESSAWLRQTKRLFPHPIFAGGISFACLLVAILFALVTVTLRIWPLAVASLLFFAGASATAAAAIGLLRDRRAKTNLHGDNAKPGKPTFAILVLLIAVYSWLLTLAMHVFHAFFKNGPGSAKYFITLGIAIVASLFTQLVGKRVMRRHFGNRGGRDLTLTGRQSFYVVLFVLVCSFYAVWLAT